MLASTAATPVAAFGSDERRLYGVQWHPEVKHSDYGQRVIENFLHKAAGLAGRLEQRQRHRRAGRAHPRAGRLGPRDLRRSRAASTPPSPPRSCTRRSATSWSAIFVDHGLLRKDEREQVENDYVASTGVRLVTIDAREQFLDALAGVSDPEQKRKIIGREFIRSFEAAENGARRRGGRRRRADPLPRAGHALPRRRRVRRRHRHREHQVAPQRRRPPRRPAVRARRAAAHPLQGRGPRDRPRARPARGDRRPPAVSGPRPRHPDRR